MNAVLVRGINDDEVEAFAEFARERGLIMRFIEFMPLDADRHWTRDMVVPAAEVYRRIHARWPLVANSARTQRNRAQIPLRRWPPGEIGLIAPSRSLSAATARASASPPTAKLRTCLFSKEDHDLQFLLREGASDDDLDDLHPLGRRWKKKKAIASTKPDFRPPIAHHGVHRRLARRRKVSASTAYLVLR